MKNNLPKLNNEQVELICNFIEDLQIDTDDLDTFCCPEADDYLNYVADSLRMNYKLDPKHFQKEEILIGKT